MKIRAASIQLDFQYFSTPQQFADFVRAPIELAAQHGAQLIVMPHELSYGLFGMFDFDAQANESLDVLARRLNLDTDAWLKERAPYVYEFYLHQFQSLSARAQVWLVPGTVLEPVEKGLFVTAGVFNPAGELIGRQRQMHRTAQEIAWGVKQGDALRVLETEIGDLGLVLGEDIRYPETARALTLNGATVLLHPSAGTFQQNALGDEQFLQDLWRDVQSNQMFGIQANLLGANDAARSALYAPVELTDDRRGILAQARDASAQIIMADLDFDALKKLRTGYPILDLLNPLVDPLVSARDKASD